MISTQIIFLPTKSNEQKLYALRWLCQRHFYQGDVIGIRTSSKAASEYIDRFLWEEPKQSFLPHSIEDFEKEKIIIFQGDRCSEAVNILINFHENIVSENFSLAKIYELIDYTSSQKLENSRNKWRLYQQKGLPLSMIEENKFN